MTPVFENNYFTFFFRFQRNMTSRFFLKWRLKNVKKLQKVSNLLNFYRNFGLRIIDSHLPGYVYLELRYLLTESGDDGNYNAVEYDKHPYTRNDKIAINSYKGVQTECHGPAVCTRLPGIMLNVDAVSCVRCPVWPSQAADWPMRHRNYGWPGSATLDRVVSNGCDVVPVAHRRCRQHEWMGKYQWRLSFSRAEIVLISSWMPEQQIVYHMLRYFVKTTICRLCWHLWSSWIEQLSH